MRNLDFTMTIFSLLFYFLVNRVHYTYAMKSYDDSEKSHLYSKFSLIARVAGRVLLMFFTYGVIRMTFGLKNTNLIAYMIAVSTIFLVYLVGTKANEKLLNKAHDKITKLRG